MDEKDNSIKPKRTRALRATDVIPPFDGLSKEADPERVAREPSSDDVRASSNRDADAGRGGVAETGLDMRHPVAAGIEIPKYDLAENILAEHRRAAARRRRGPSQAQEQPVATPRSAGLKPSLAKVPSDDLPELQRIVAEIVARDIDRLCKRPAR